MTQVDEVGRVRSMFVKRRDLLREHNLQPRDLRRIDPSLELSKASPSLTIKDNCLLINMGGIRAIVTAHRALLFEPRSGTSQKFLQLLVAKLTSQERQRALRRFGMLGGPGLKSPGGGGGGADPETFSHQEYMERYYSNDAEDQLPPPFELEVLEGALTVASSRMDAELLAVSRRCTTLLTKLPRYITPVNLEELRRIKSALVELEDKADSLRCVRACL